VQPLDHALLQIRAVEPRPESLRVPNAQKIIIDFRYQTFHVWLPSHRGSAAKIISTFTIGST
jgi:hypothetical protein